jgi:predicted dehydrogenase
MTNTSEQGRELTALADANDLKLQVGHIERFNPALLSARDRLGAVQFIECHRLAPFKGRGADVNVVLDLMIHDLDIVLSLAKSPIIDVRAVGFSILSEAEDIAQARLEFADGSVANFTASRCSAQPQRTMQFIGKDCTATIDFAQQTAVVMRPGSEFARVRSEFDGSSTAQNNHWKEHLFEEVLELENLPIEDANAILCEQQEFIDCIRFAQRPTVSGHQAKAALAVAERITNAMSVQAWCDNQAIDRESVIPVFKHLSAPHQPTIPRRKAG